jgi:hypothetical protein
MRAYNLVTHILFPFMLGIAVGNAGIIITAINAKKLKAN